MAPTIVRTKSGHFVTDLAVSDFEIYDQNKRQKVAADLRDSPFSMVVAVQRSADMSGILPIVRRIGPAITDLVAGQDGEVAVVSFDDRLEVKQDFTSDGDKVCQSMMELKPGTYSHAVIDAVMESVRLLQNRPRERRRIVLVISEKWDKDSRSSLREALLKTQFANVSIYSLDVSTAVAEMTSEPMPQRPPAIPTTAQHIPAGGALTPITIEQNYYLGNWVPIFEGIFRSVENVFTDNTLEALTRFSGGEGYSFTDDWTLGDAIQKLSEDLHSQYVLSYSPNNLEKSGFHPIRVVVRRRDMVVRTRPGYWIGGKPY
jgi:VWFA-related protein